MFEYGKIDDVVLTLKYSVWAEVGETCQHEVRQHLDVVVVNQATLNVSEKLKNVNPETITRNIISRLLPA